VVKSMTFALPALVMTMWVHAMPERDDGRGSVTGTEVAGLVRGILGGGDGWDSWAELADALAPDPSVDVDPDSELYSAVVVAGMARAIADTLRHGPDPIIIAPREAEYPRRLHLTYRYWLGFVGLSFAAFLAAGVRRLRISRPLASRSDGAARPDAKLRKGARLWPVRSGRTPPPCRDAVRLAARIRSSDVG